MNKLFGISMDSIMHAVLAAFILVTLVVALLAVRNPLFLKLGVRNIPRRHAQSVLIVFGLMLSTLIVTTAFTAGDTFSYSIRSSAASGLGGVDEIVSNTPKPTDRSAPVAVGFMPGDTVQVVRSAVAAGNDVDGVVGALAQVTALQDLTTRQTSAQADTIGLPGRYPPAFGALTTTAGTVVTLGQLGPDEVYINKEVAAKLDAHAGDRVRVFVNGHPVARTVRAVVQNEGMAGGGLLGHNAIDPVVLMPLGRLQRVTGRPGQITHVLISNRGDVLGGAALTQAVLAELHASSIHYPVQAAKLDALNVADQAGTELTAAFVAFGLFSIAAGVLLILMIFVMLSAERRSEMGMARAVGTKRRHLIQQFVFEGYVYDLGAALVGVVLGMLVGLGMTSVMASLVNSTGFFHLDRHVEPRSVVVAFCLGALVTFVTVVVSSWRVSRLNLVAAIRDLPDTTGRGGSVRAAFVRPVVDLRTAGRRLRRRSLGGGFGALLAAVWHAVTAFRVFVSRGPVPLVIGYLLVELGNSSRQLFPFDLGVSLLLIGAALSLRWVLGVLGVRDRVRDRLSYTLLGISLVVFWLLPFDFFRPDLQFGVEMFVLSGLMITLGGVLTAMYNVDIVLGRLLVLSNVVGRLTLVLKMAVTYPMQHRFRTGMTLFMFSLIMFALMVQAVLTSSFGAQGLNLNRDIGGYQVYGETSPGTSIVNVAGRVAASPALRGRVAAAGSVGQVALDLSQPGGSQLQSSGSQFRYRHVTNVADRAYLSTTRFTLHSRASGYASDQGVWQTLLTHPGYAVVDGSLVATTSGGTGSNGGFRIRGFHYEDRSFKPQTIEMSDPRTGRTMPVTVIGVLDVNAGAFTRADLYTSRSTLQAAHEPVPAPSGYYFRVAPGQDVHRAALALGSAFLPYGLEVHETQQLYNTMQSVKIGFNALLEGFMALGLVVGIAALGVIATRVVVERRQQIGMMRAIGFKRRTVQTAFLLESSFVAVLGTLLGGVLGILLGWQLEAHFAKTQLGLQLVIPWGEIALIVAGAYLASLLTTYLPSWQASRVYPAEALRYE